MMSRDLTACLESTFVVIVVFVTHILTSGLSLSFGTYYLPLLETFGTSRALTSWIGSLNYGMLCLSGPLVSMVIQRWGCRTAMMTGGILTFIGLSTSSLITNIYLLYLTFGIITGTGFGFCFTTCVVSVTFYFHKNRPLFMGLTISGIGVGGFLQPLFNQFLINTFNWRGAFLINSALSLNVCAGAIALGCVVTPGGKNAVKKERKSLMSSYAVWILFVNSFLFCFGMNITFMYVISYTVSRGYSKTLASLALSSLGIANVLGRILLGCIANKRGINITVLFATSYLFAGLSVIILPLWNKYYFILCCGIVFGIFSAAYGPVLCEITYQLVGVADFSRVYGMLLIAMGSGSIIGPPMAGLVVDETGYYPAVFYLGGTAVTAAGLLVLLLLFRKRPSENPLENKRNTEELLVEERVSEV